MRVTCPSTPFQYRVSLDRNDRPILLIFPYNGVLGFRATKGLENRLMGRIDRGSVLRINYIIDAVTLILLLREP